MTYRTYQVIIEVDEGTDIDLLPDSFKAFSHYTKILAVSKRPMPDTRAFNGRMLFHLEIEHAEGAHDFLEIVKTGIATEIGQTWTITAAQPSFKELVVDANGDPVLVDDGEGNLIEQYAVKADVPLSEKYFLDFMPDKIDRQGKKTRPKKAAPHKIAGAEDWVIVV